MFAADERSRIAGAALLVLWLVAGRGQCGAAVTQPKDEEQIVLRCAGGELALSRQGRLVSLRDGQARDYAVAGTPFLTAKVGGRWVAVTRLAFADSRLSAVFGQDAATAEVLVSTRPRSLVFEVARASDGIEALRFVNIRTKPCVQAGSSGPIVFEHFSVSLVPLGLLTHCGVSTRRKSPGVTAVCTRQFGLVGTRAALVLCPVASVPEVVDGLQQAYNLPRGMRRRRLPDNRKGYLFVSGTTEDNADEVIAAARAAGLGQILFVVWSWTRYGQLFEIRKTSFPHGEEGLARVVDKIHAAGLKAGIHLFASKTPKVSAYTQGAADPGLLKDHWTALAQPLDAQADRIVTAEPPKGFPTKEPYERDLQIGGEILTYRDVSLAEPFGFLGCQRGRYGTLAAPHATGARVGHLYIPPWGGGSNLFIFDHESPLFQRVTQRIADVYNRCGFDAIYFDGWMQKPYWRYVPLAQWEVYRRLKREPVVWEEAVGSPFSAWHLITRAGQRDYYGGLIRTSELKKGVRGTIDGFRDEIDDSVTRRVPGVRRNLLPPEIGWYPVKPPSAKSRGSQLDDVEYLCARALAYDTAFSLLTSYATIARHARAGDLFRVIGQWERLRLAGHFDQPTRERLKQPGQDFTLFRDAKGAPHILPATRIDRIAGTDDVRGMVFEHDGAVYVSFWHTWGQAKIAVALPAAHCTLLDGDGKPAKLTARDGRLALGVGDRQWLACRGIPKAHVVEAFNSATLVGSATFTIWLQAERCARVHGAMARGSEVGLADPGAMGDFLVPTAKADRDHPPDAYAEFAVDIPHRGLWHVWARFRYPSGADDSFSLVPAGARVVGDGSQWFGNSGARAIEWHWDGKGRGTAAMPGAASRDVLIPRAGRWTFRVYAREAAGPVARNPRLDALCITNSFRFVPTDAMAKRELSRP